MNKRQRKKAKKKRFNYFLNKTLKLFRDNKILLLSTWDEEYPPVEIRFTPKLNERTKTIILT